MPYNTYEKRRHNQRCYRIAKKIQCYNHLGGKCKVCCENNIFKMSIHHKGTKEFGFSKKRWALKWENLLKELQDCELLCFNCHAELHFNELSNVELKRTTKAARISKEVLLNYKNASKCKLCGYSKNKHILNFHHTHDKLKEIGNIKDHQFQSLKNVSESDLKELDKCIVVCPNCHNVAHSDIEFFEQNKKEILQKANNVIENKEKFTDEEVIELRNKGLTFKEIALLKNCAESSIGQRLKKLGLTNPRSK